MRPIILASRSQARGRLLAAAGVSFSTVSADIDERAADAPLVERGVSPRDVALHLGQIKAAAVSARYPEAFVIGADQTLDLDGERLTNPETVAEARAQLKRLRGREHQLHTAVASATNGRILWRHVSSARLVMRDFSARFLDEYIDTCGERTIGSVGAYHLEANGIQLFERVDGDYFTILGLPMLPLLEHLRDQNLILQ